MKKYINAIVIILGVILIDQLSKLFIQRSMELGDSIKVIEDLFYITSHRNSGAAWGMLEGQMIFFYIMTVIVLGLLMYLFMYEAHSRLMQYGIALIIGGAIGNFIDRVLYQHVIDFIDVYIGSYDFPIFNIADSALTIGVILLFIHMMKDFISDKKQQKMKTK